MSNLIKENSFIPLTPNPSPARGEGAFRIMFINSPLSPLAGEGDT